MSKSLENRLSNLEDTLFPSYPTNSGACKMAKKYDEDFEGDTVDALTVIDAGIREEAERAKKE